LKDAAIEEFTTHTLRCFEIPVQTALCEPLLLKTMDCNLITIQETRRTIKSFSFDINETENHMFVWKHTPDIKKQVFVACSFDGWKRHQMNFQNHEWKICINMRPGIYQYKYIIDEEW